MKSVAIVSSGYLPVPDVLGGAVEGLINCIINENEAEGDLALRVYSTSEPEAVAAARGLKGTEMVFIETPAAVLAADKAIHWFAKNVLRKRKNMSWAHILKRVHYLSRVSAHLSEHPVDALVLENHATQFSILRSNGNRKRYMGRTFFHLHNEVAADYGNRELMCELRSALCVSDYIARSFADHMGWEVGDTRLKVLKNCASAEFFEKGRSGEARAEARGRYGIGDDEFVVLFSGRLTVEKGALELLDAFAAAKIPDSRLLIAGAYFFKDRVSSPYEEALKKKAAALGDRVVFTGFVEHADMASLYAACDVVCNPSIWDDPAPLANIEGLAAGKPVVSTYSGGVPEYVDNTCGVLLKRDIQLVENLTATLSGLADNPAWRSSLVEGARTKSQTLDVKSYYGNFVGLIESLELDGE